jgi:hypothetical protein
MTDKSLSESLTTSTPFYFICIFFFGLAALSAFVLKESAVNVSAEVRTVWQRINLFKRLSVLFSNQRLQFLLMTSTFFTLAVDMFYEFGPVYLTLKWALGPAQLTVYNGVLCLGLAIGNGWLPTFFASRISNRAAILSSIAGFALIITESSWLIPLS